MDGKRMMAWFWMDIRTIAFVIEKMSSFRRSWDSVWFQTIRKRRIKFLEGRGSIRTEFNVRGLHEKSINAEKTFQNFIITDFVMRFLGNVVSNGPHFWTHVRGFEARRKCRSMIYQNRSNFHGPHTIESAISKKNNLTHWFIRNMGRWKWGICSDRSHDGN